MKIIHALILIVAISLPALRAHAFCTASWLWMPKVFASDAVHYAAADLDGDGIDEILGTSDTALSVRRMPAPTPVVVYTGTSLGAPLPGDFDGNGTVDVVLARRDGDALVFLPGNGDGTFGVPVVTPLPFLPRHVAAGNFTGSANLDVAVIGSGSVLLLMQGDGTGTFASVGEIAVAANPHRILAANFDADAYADVAVSHTSSVNAEIVFSHGDGTGTIVPVVTGDSAVLAAGDIDGDGDLDLVTESLPSHSGTVVNAGARVFRTGLVAHEKGAVETIGLADLNNDGRSDIVIPYMESLGIRIQQKGGYQWVDLQPIYAEHGDGSSLAFGDFNGDGYVDMVLEEGKAGRGTVYLNGCGYIQLLLFGPRLVSVGEPFTVRVTVHRPNAAAGGVPTGTATLRSRGEVVATAAVALNAAKTHTVAQFVVPGLSPGAHEIEVEYSGDVNYPALTNRIYVTTTDVVTTVAVIPSITNSEWGQPVTFTASVTSSGGEAQGYLYFFAKGVQVGHTYIGSTSAQPTFVTTNLPGDTSAVEWSFNPSKQPWTEGSIPFRVEKAVPKIFLEKGRISRLSENFVIDARLQTTYGGIVSGSLTLSGAEPYVLRQAKIENGQAVFNLGVTFYGHGRRLLRLSYPGDPNNLPVTLDFHHTAFHPSAYFPLVATPVAPNAISVEWIPMADTETRLYRKAAGGGWELMPVRFSWSGRFHDTAVTPGSAYQYRAEAWSGETHVATTEIDTAWLGSFTDTELTGVPVKTIHFVELRSMMNALRATIDLPPLTIDFTGVVRAATLIQLRQGFQELQAALGLPPLVFTDTLSPHGTSIRAIHIEDLRAIGR